MWYYIPSLEAKTLSTLKMSKQRGFVNPLYWVLNQSFSLLRRTGNSTVMNVVLITLSRGLL